MTTVILGLGSSLGDRLGHLRRALGLLRQTPGCTVEQVSPVYLSDALLPDNAPPEWDAPYLNLALRCEVSLPPHDLLAVLKQTEQKAGRRPEKKWGPRVIDIDLLAYGDQVLQSPGLQLPHAHLPSRPFALWPLADVAPDWRYPLPGPQAGWRAAEMVAAWGSRFTGNAPFHTRQIAQRVDTPELVGILNITPDSFSDGGQLSSVERLLQQAEALVNGGATVLDLGAEATHPSAHPIEASEEWQRLQPVLPVLLEASRHFVIPPAISLDTRHVKTAEQALALGIHWINDVSGLETAAMRQLAAEQDCKIVIMHQLGLPARKEITLSADSDPVSAVLSFGKNRIQSALAAGISPENIIFDPGIGFGKTTSQSIHLLKNIRTFRSLGVPLMVGHSRKRFLADLSPASAAERDPETSAISIFLAQHNVEFLRIHNAALHSRQWQALAPFMF